MKPSRLFLILGLLVLPLVLTSFILPKPELKPVKKIIPSVDPEAVDIFRGAMEYLSNLQQFSVRAQSTMEDLHDSGHRIDFEVSSSVTVSRPDKIHIERHGLDLAQIFYFNGEYFTISNPSEKVYASESAPGTIEDMFHFARDTYGLSVPVSDLLYSDAFSLLMEDVNYAIVIGKEMIGEVQCDHLLFSRPGVDFQLWIADGGPPLVYKYVVTDTATPELLAYTTVMRNWNLAPAVSEDLFEFIPSQGTERIIILEAY